MKVDRKKLAIVTLAMLVVLFLGGMIIHLYSVYTYNKTERKANADDENGSFYVHIEPRGGATSTWEKRELKLKAAIFDASVKNNSSYDIDNWSLIINIEKDCYINQFWNGTTEIHQYVGTADEKVQTIDLASYNKDDITLDHIFDASDLLIPLKKGDMVVYHPNAEFKETPLKTRQTIVVGMILYYNGEMEIADYGVVYHFHKFFTQGVGFIIVCFLFGLLILEFLICVTAALTYRRAKKEIGLKLSGISYMSEIYDVIYLIDLEKDSITPVTELEDSKSQRPVDLSANEQLENLFNIDSLPTYTNMIQCFSDLETLPDRMENRNSLVAEYVSKSHGWCRIRFIAAERDKNALTKVIFTLEEINKEKEELLEMQGQIEHAQSKSREKSEFLDSVSRRIRPSIELIQKNTKEILPKESGEKRRKLLTIMGETEKLLFVVRSIVELSKLESGKEQLQYSEFSLAKMIRECIGSVDDRFKASDTEITTDITSSLPDMIYCDKEKLKSIIINLMHNACEEAIGGTVRLAVFGKMTGQKDVHLLISVKTSPKKGSENAEIEVGKGLRTGMKMAEGFSAVLGTHLKRTDTPDGGSDIYFELDCTAVSTETIGNFEYDN